MTLDSESIKKIYAGKVAKAYDYSMAHFFPRLKEMAFRDSSLKEGHHVLVFCCGTGLDFAPILQRIGEEGKIVGVDFSPVMLKKAEEKTRKENWKNVGLIEADVTKFQAEQGSKFDAGVCTLGMSIIPDYRAAFQNLVSHVKTKGEIIVGDLQLAPGWLAFLNPLIVFLAKRYGGTYQGHQNSLELYALMKKELTEVTKKELVFKSYFYSIGKTK